MLQEVIRHKELKPVAVRYNRSWEEMWQSAELLFSNKDWFLAKAIYAKLHELAPQESIYLQRLGECFKELNEIENAQICYEQLCNLEISFINYVATGSFFYDQKNFYQAKRYYLKAICHQTEDYAHSFEMFKNLGNIAVYEEDYDQALEYYNKAHRIFDGSDILSVNYGSLYFQQKNFEKAIEAYQKALEINLKSEKAYLGLALVYRELGDDELSGANIKKGLDIKPFDRLLLRTCAQWALADFQYSTALDSLQSYMEHQGFDLEISTLFACILFQSGNRENCYWECQKILAFEPNNEDARKLIDLLHSIEGKHDPVS